MLVEVASVSKHFDDGATRRSVLRELSIDVMRGERIAVTGPSGSGKTTLLNLLAGLLLPDAGEIRFHGDEGVLALSRLSSRERAGFRRRHIGYVFQFFNLVPTLTVAENVRLPLALAGRNELIEEALARLDDLGLADRAETFPARLSGGEQQRVAIARDLAHRPALVVADEPTGNLDAAQAERVIDLLWRHARAVNAAVIVATHSERIATAADRRVRLGS